MSKGFKLSLLSIIGLIMLFLVIGNLYQPKFPESRSSLNVNNDTKLNQTAMAAHEHQTTAENEKQNPTVTIPITVNQTEEYIAQIEELRNTNTSINLNYLPDVAAQSRRYNSSVDQAIAIYGDNDITNPYKYCTDVAWMARELWRQTYSPLSVSKEYRNQSEKLFLKTYEGAKKACISDVKANLNGTSSA